MRTLSSLLLVSLSIGVAAPVAAAPRVPVAGLPGVSDVLLNIAVAAPAVTWPGNDSEQPGSVLVFPKFIRGTFDDAAVSGQLVHARTELEISVRCPDGATCGLNQAVRMRAHWVCPGCTESSFDLETTVGGTLYFNTEGVTVLAAVVTAQTFPNNATTTIPVPPCDRGYLIVWVIDGGGNAIKFDGLIGDAILRDPPTVPFATFPFTARGYNAIPIQAAEFLSTGDFTDQDGERDLDFDENEYRAITGRIFGTVRYENNVLPEGNVETDLTLLTLDVASNRPNPITSVGLNFYSPDEQFVDVGISFFCWAEERLTTILATLNKQNMGRKGLVESFFAEQNGVPVTLLALVETIEFDVVTFRTRDYSYSLFHDGNLVVTSFKP